MNPVSTIITSFAILALIVYVLRFIEALITVGFGNIVVAATAPIIEVAGLFRREDLVPENCDGFLFRSAPTIALASVALGMLVIPIGYEIGAFDPSIGVFYFLVVLGPFVIAMMNAGWSQNSHEGIIAAFRAAAHLISYEVPIGFAAIGPVMAAGSLSTVKIVNGQAGLWYIVWQPLGFALFISATLAMTYRRPFDTPQAGTDLESGVLGEYTGARYAVFSFALDGLFLLLCALASTLFLGGWRGPLLPGPVWLIAKTVAVALLILLIGHRCPRMRPDQMLSVSWKILLPAALLNIAIVGVLALVLPSFKS